MPTAAIKDRSFSPPFAKSSGKSTWRSSSAPISQRALRSCPSDGSSNAPSPGSTAAAAWPRIGSASTERPWRSCAWPQSASCCESSVKKHHDPGRTLSLSPIGQYSHLLGGYPTLAPLYAFVVGVLIHFRGARIASLIGPRHRIDNRNRHLLLLRNKDTKRARCDVG